MIWYNYGRIKEILLLLTKSSFLVRFTTFFHPATCRRSSCWYRKDRGLFCPFILVYQKPSVPLIFVYGNGIFDRHSIFRIFPAIQITNSKARLLPAYYPNWWEARKSKQRLKAASQFISKAKIDTVFPLHFGLHRPTSSIITFHQSKDTSSRCTRQCHDAGKKG